MAGACGRQRLGRLPSHGCTLGDLAEFLTLTDADRGSLRLGPDWARRWTARFATAQGVLVRSVAELREGLPPDAVPVRRFSWRTGQRHRPGLQYLVGTGRHHGFESLAEQRLLLALDFVGVEEVLAQPFEMRVTTVEGSARHVPDFLVTGSDGTWLIDVRPGHRIRPEDRTRFAAAAELALALGWRFAVVTGWRPGVIGTVDALSAQRRPLADPLGLQQQLLNRVREGPSRFGNLVDGTSVPVMARAHALHLIWHRRLGIDLTEPLGDEALVWAAMSSGVASAASAVLDPVSPAAVNRRSRRVISTCTRAGITAALRFRSRYREPGARAQLPNRVRHGKHDPQPGDDQRRQCRCAQPQPRPQPC